MVSPGPSITSSRKDAFGNHLTAFSFNDGFNRLEVETVNEVTIQAGEFILSNTEPAWNEIRDQLKTNRDDQYLDAFQFVFASDRIPLSDELSEYAAISFRQGRGIVDALSDLTTRIFYDFEFDPTATDIHTPVIDVLRNRRGVCQDFAHLQIGLLRSLGLSARYVSGYIRTHPPAGQPRLIGADASHAWLSVFCGELGWIDVDPTNNAFPTTDHIWLAWGRDYNDVCPIKGVFVGEGHRQMTVSVDVEPIEELSPSML